VNFVLDASTALAWLLGDSRPGDRPYAASVLGALKSPETRASVPVIWGLEIANVIARCEARGVLTEAQSGAFLAMLNAVAIHPDEATHGHALGATLDLARRHGLSSYDAAYLELALRKALPMSTLDDALAKAARRAGVQRFNP
jgi:predicted nucleic acid-binding protein